MDDLVIACADLVKRAGAAQFELGYTNDQATRTEDAAWYAAAYYQGARIIEQDHRSPDQAAIALASRLLAGATCKCGEPVTLADGTTGCRWQLLGQRWEPGCDAPPVTVKRGKPGDIDAINEAMTERLAERGKRP